MLRNGDTEGGRAQPRVERAPWGHRARIQCSMSQKAPGALPWDPRDPRTLILPKKSNQIPGEPNSSAGPAPAHGGRGADLGGRDSQG